MTKPRRLDPAIALYRREKRKRQAKVAKRARELAKVWRQIVDDSLAPERRRPRLAR